MFVNNFEKTEYMNTDKRDQIWVTRTKYGGVKEPRRDFGRKHPREAAIKE